MARNQRLPGMEDQKIEGLHNAAAEYAEIRDQRQQLTTQEVELKAKLLRLMKQHKKTEYDFEGVHIELVTEEETVKVRIKKTGTEEDED